MNLLILNDIMVLCILYRVLSRVCVVPFTKPSISPTTDEQQDAFDDLDDILEGGLLSSVYGWVIQQRRVLEDKERIRDMKRQLRAHFAGRSALNWSLVVTCLQQVRWIDIGE